MAYAVELTRRAERDLVDLYEFLSAENSTSARQWFNGLEKAISTLGRFPRRCPFAPDARKAGWPLRHLLFGKGLDVYRILFEIHETRRVIRIVAVRHGARDDFVSSERAKSER
jgi:plasmid stabilization system protein ParE